MRIKELQCSLKITTISTVVCHQLPSSGTHDTFKAMTNYESTPNNDQFAIEVTARNKQSLVILSVVWFLSLDRLFIVEWRITDEDCYCNIFSQEQGCKRLTH